MLLWASHALGERRIRLRLSQRGVPLFKVFDVNDPIFIEEIRKRAPDLILSAAYPQIFSGALITLASRGAINFHPSALPRCRGAHPHFWAIAKGEDIGGVTAHYMTERIDEGDIVAQITFPIAGYYYEEHYRKIVDEAPLLVTKVREFFSDPAVKPVKQDRAAATYFKNDREIHRRIFWNVMSAKEIYDLIRTERSFCFFRCATRVQIAKASLSGDNRNMTNGARAEAGTIIDAGDDVIVCAKDGLIAIHAFRRRGGSIGAGEWAKCARVMVGEKFV